MSSITPGAIQAVGTAALNTYQQTKAALAGHPDLVHFLDVRTGECIFQFDAVINEQHSRDALVTQFPVETGQVVTDHIVVSPPELTVQGIITDSPIGNARSLLTEAIATGVTFVSPPLLVAAYGAAYGAASSYQADQGTKSPSQIAFTKLMRLMGGDPETTPPTPPSLVHVHTKMALYTNMAIKSVTLPRDKTVSNAIIVQVALQKVFLVTPQTVNIGVLANPQLAAAKADEGNKALEETTRKVDAAAEYGVQSGRQTAEVPIGAAKGALSLVGIK